MDPLELELKSVRDQIVAKIEQHAASHGAIADQLKQQIDSLQKQADAIDARISERHSAGGGEQKSLRQILEADDSILRLLRDRKGQAIFTLRGDEVNLLERKSTITSSAVGAATTGVLTIDRVPGITGEARQQLTIRNVLSARPTALQLVDFVKVDSPMTIASPQTEASDKAENAVTFTSVSEKVHTLATWIPATRQVLDDMTELMGFLMSSLPYYVNLEEELQILSGSGVGDDYNGLITQAAAFDTSLLPNLDGWNRIDVIGYASQQLATAKELQPTFVALNPADWWVIRLTKDTRGRYILGDPQQPAGASTTLFGLTPVITTSVPSGTFLLGSGDPAAAEIRDRQEMAVEISTQHNDYFIKNMVAIRAEKRGCLVVKRPNSYVTGSFSTSP